MITLPLFSLSDLNHVNGVTDCNVHLRSFERNPQPVWVRKWVCELALSLHVEFFEKQYPTSANLAVSSKCDREARRMRIPAVPLAAAGRRISLEPVAPSLFDHGGGRA